MFYFFFTKFLRKNGAQSSQRFAKKNKNKTFLELSEIRFFGSGNKFIFCHSSSPNATKLTSPEILMKYIKCGILLLPDPLDSSQLQIPPQYFREHIPSFRRYIALDEILPIFANIISPLYGLLIAYYHDLIAS